MEELHLILKNGYRFCLLLSAVIGAFYLIKLKKSYWRWLSIYLIVIFFQENFWRFNFFSFDMEFKIAYYALLGVPLEYMFLYWLYAYKSLKNKKIFLISVVTYIVPLGIFAFFKNLNEVLSVSINVGTIILIVLIILEFIKQIKNDDILHLKENKMFYINIGLVLFYIGSYPYQVFGKELYESNINLWNIYHIYSLISNCIMYLLFAASFIWGKTHS